MEEANLEAALEAQQTLVESSLELVRTTYRESLDEGVKRPVVVLVDCEDDLGGQVARGWLGDEEIDDAIALQHADNEADHDADAGVDTTVFARALPWNEAAGDLREAFPYLAPALDTPPSDDGVFVISITAGGASALTAPLEDTTD
ncbi:MAG: hypothetical protein AAFV43_07015 [Planctomycetota bacterium]